MPSDNESNFKKEDRIDMPLTKAEAIIDDIIRAINRSEYPVVTARELLDSVRHDQDDVRKVLELAKEDGVLGNREIGHVEVWWIPSR